MEVMIVDFIQIHIFVKLIENIKNVGRRLFHLLHITTGSGFRILNIFVHSTFTFSTI